MAQKHKVLKHLRSREKITSIEAIGLYGITRLAAVVLQLKDLGHIINSVRKKGVNGNYVEYHLEAGK